MKLRPSPLFAVAAKDRFSFDERIIDELHLLTTNISQHPFKNLVAVIYYNLKKNGYLRRLPTKLQKKLKEAYYNALLLDMHQRNWLENFIRNLLPKDVTIILLKGSANWGTIYTPQAPRTGCDIDILVREDDFERVVKIMNNIGQLNIIDESRPFSNKNAYEYSYKLSGAPVGVEIHRRISYPFVGRIDYDELFQITIPHPYYEDKRVLILKPKERLVHTLIHTLKHADINAHEVVDSYRIITKYNLSQEEIIKNAAQYGLLSYAEIFLLFITELVDGRGEISLKRGLRDRIFCLLHCSDIRIRFRIRQLLSILLLDDFMDTLRFSKFYIALRAKDLFYNCIQNITGKNYAE